MKISAAIFAALTIAVLATTAMADDATEVQEEQQACGNDVYTFCGDAIPDHDRIAACLKKHWKEISKECRTVMINYRHKHHGKHKDHAATGQD